MTASRSPALRLCAPGLAGLALLLPEAARAHATNQSFVLLLPTDLYAAAGVASVAVTVLFLALAPGRVALAIFGSRPVARLKAPRLRLAASTASFGLLLALVWIGLTGSRDPLSNPLTLTVWTVWWIGLVVAQGLFGNLWSWLSPWTAPAALVRALRGARPPLRYPRRLGHLPALAGFLGFAGFLLADIAPSDPARLAQLTAAYTVLTLAGIAAFGRAWLLRAEPLTVFMRSYGRLGLYARGRAGLWGWQALAAPVSGASLAVFMLAILAVGSFDGLNETFWWLGLIGVNPLEFPGRSAVVVPNLLGLVAANAALAAVFALTLHLGLRLAGAGMGTGRAFRLFAPSLLPIAIGYHIAHYLPSALVEGQYVLAAATDPLGTGADLLGLGTFYVTTGFFNTQASVRAIFLTQAGAVVAGHVLAILLAHAIGVRYLGTARAATLAQAPLAAFMLAYTFFGLWLLASPRG